MSPLFSSEIQGVFGKKLGGAHQIVLTQFVNPTKNGTAAVLSVRPNSTDVGVNSSVVSLRLRILRRIEEAFPELE
jgi:hypothetical protein